MKEWKKQIIAAGICMILAIGCIGIYHIGALRSRSVDLKEVSVLHQKKGIELYVNHIEYEGKKICVTAAAKNNTLKCNYVNHVLGPGTGIYKKKTILLVDEKEQKGYCLKTYPYTFSPENEKKERFCQQDGVIAYGSGAKLQDKSLKVAVLFEDQEGKEYVLYETEKGI